MTGRDGSGPDRTVFQPSPLQQRRKAASGTAFTPGADGAQAAEQPAHVSARLADDIPTAPEGVAARNPMMMLAAPLLALLAAMRAGRAQMQLPELHKRAGEEIEAFRQQLRTTYTEEELRRATYALAATADDIALNLPFKEADVAEWAQRSLVVRFFHEAIGGDRFWRLLEEMIAQPGDHADLLELYHSCMAAGFEGRYRITNDGAAQHAAIMQRVFQALPHPTGLSRTEVSPQWRGVVAPAATVGLWGRIAMVAGVAAGALLVVYLALHLWLGRTGQPAREAVGHLVESEPLTLSRAAPVTPPPPSIPAGRIRQELAGEIQKGEAEVLDEPTAIRVRITVPGLFAPGSDRLLPAYSPLFLKVAQALNAEGGGVRVEGHTDTDPPHDGATFTDNQQLSQARAEAAAAVIRNALTNKSRAVTAVGLGAGRPLASNKTAEGKSRNRRVEVIVERSDQ